jgi:hypothetical protein
LCLGRTLTSGLAGPPLIVTGTLIIANPAQLLFQIHRTIHQQTHMFSLTTAQ